MLRDRGYPTGHRAAQVNDDHLSRRSGGGTGPQPPSDPRRPGVDRDRLRMLRSFDPRSGAHVPDVETRALRRPCRLRDGASGDRRRCRAARLGRRAPGGGELMRRLSFLLRPGWVALALGGGGVRLPVPDGCSRPGSWARTPRPRGEQPDRGPPCRPIPFPGDFASAQTGFVGTRCAVAACHRNRPLPAPHPGARAAAGDRRLTGLPGAQRLRRRRWPDGVGEPQVRASEHGTDVPPIEPRRRER